MRITLLLIFAVAISCCSEEETQAVDTNNSNEPLIMMKTEDVRSYEDLRLYLDQRYPQVEELPVTALISSGMDTRVPYKYRLQDSREFTIPIIFTASNERIVDPDFDLDSLPY